MISRMIFIWMLLKILAVTCGRTTYQVYNFTWQVINEANDVAFSTSLIGRSPAWPVLTPDLCKLAAGGNSYWGLPHQYVPLDKAPHGSGFDERYVGCNTVHRRTNNRETDFYVCPGNHRDRTLNYKCGYRDSFYCASWGCETTGDAYWKPSSSWDYITVKKGWKNSQRNSTLTQECRNTETTKGWCNPLLITFTEAGKGVSQESWMRGHEWGLRMYVANKDPGLIFKIKLQKTLPKGSAAAIGPNPALHRPAQPGPPIRKSPGIVSSSTPSPVTFF